MSLHYLVKGGCSKFLPNTGFVTIRLLRFGVKVKRAHCRDNFLAQRPLPVHAQVSGDSGQPVHELAVASDRRRFLSASLYFSKRALIEIGCVVTSLVVGCHARALWPNGAS